MCTIKGRLLCPAIAPVDSNCGQNLPTPFNFSFASCLPSYCIPRAQVAFPQLPWRVPRGGENSKTNQRLPLTLGANCHIRRKEDFTNNQTVLRKLMQAVRKVQTAYYRRSEDRKFLLLFSVFDSSLSSRQIISVHTSIFPYV